ncbi:MAG: hypothetical protein GY913_23370 [Proteobacteria bacterium]|nr:hypothetical protein [Pseudomonadota bacterium]MCP4919853.1 hypothetical protein [Pseudomonadota bacterium]
MLLLTLWLGCSAEAANADEASTEGSVAATPWPEGDSRGMQEIISSLQSRERALERREKTVEAREEELRQVEEELEARIAELETLRTDIGLLLDDGDEERQRRVKAVIKMTETMRSGDAGVFVSELDDGLAVEVLDGMNPTKAGKVLASMEPAKAASLAEQLTLPTLQQGS